MSSGRQRTRKRKRSVYRIVVRSELSYKDAAAFKGMEMQARDGDTILTGEIIDQPHLFGTLERINGLGLQLLSVQVLPQEAYRDTEGKRGADL